MSRRPSFVVRSLVPLCLLLEVGCTAPTSDEEALGVEKQAVWVNLGGHVTANPFYNQDVNTYPQNSRGLPLLHSRPTAPAVLFMDYDGGTFQSGGTYPPSDYENIAWSTTSNAIGTGAKTFTVPTGLNYVPGDRVRAVASDPNYGNYMEGRVGLYNAFGRLDIAVDTVGGSGTYANWRIQNLQNVTFNADERASILDQWHAMAMWYSLYNIDVTTEQPPSGSTKPLLWMEVSFSNGGYGGPYPNTTGAGTISGDTPGPNSNPAHESAHTFGVAHSAEFDFNGIELNEYSPSADTPITTSFMGKGQETQHTKMVKWGLHIGGTAGNSPLDILRIESQLTKTIQSLQRVGVNNYLAPDEPDGSADFSGTRNGAAPLIDITERSYARSGIINYSGDVDYFLFQPPLDGYYSILVGRDQPSNIDTAVSIENNTATVIAESDGDPSDPSPKKNVHDHLLTRFFNAGSSYYIRVSAHGGLGDLGQYVVRASYVGDADNPWQVNDIGVNGVPGYAKYNPDGHTYVIAGSGYHHESNREGLTLMSQTLQGDGEITARVTHLDTNNEWGYAGITMRESLAPGSRHVTLVMTKRHGWFYFYRNATGGALGGGSQGNNLSFTAKYLKIVRSGDTYSFFASIDGVSWGAVGTPQTFSMGSRPVLIGLTSAEMNRYFVDPLNSGTRPDLFSQRLAVAALRNVGLQATGSGVLNPPPYAGGSGLTAPVVTMGTTTYSTIPLTWTDPNSTEAGYIVERSEDKITWTERITLPANSTFHTDVALSDARNYHYRVRAKASNGSASNPSAVRTGVTKPGPVNIFNIRKYALEGGTVVLYWDDVDGETGYRIYRKTTGAFQLVGTTSANTPVFIDTLLSPTTTYSYSFETLHADGGTTPTSGAVSVTTRATSRPSPFVQNVPVVGVIPLDWANISIGPFTPGEYRVYRRHWQGTEWDPQWTLIGTPASSAYSDATVVSGERYQYQVVACTTDSMRACSAAGAVEATAP